MRKRCGITTDLKTRKGYWEGRVTGLKGWTHVKTYQTREKAQEWEDEHDSTWEKYKGGREPDDSDKPWCCYEFKFISDSKDKKK